KTSLRKPSRTRPLPTESRPIRERSTRGFEMQPEYPKTYRQLQRLLHDTLQNYRRSNSYFANVPARILPEGHTTRLIRDDGSVDEPKHRPYKEEALFDASEQFDLSAELVLERLTKAMSDMISSETRDWIQVIDET